MNARTSLCRVATLNLVMAALACCAPPDPDRVGRVMELSGNATSGAAVYTRACASCHDADGNGTSEPMSSLVPAESDEGLADVVAGGNHVSQSSMTEQEAADLIAYLRATWPG